MLANARGRNQKAAGVLVAVGMALRVARATKPAGPFHPGSRVIDENTDKLSAALVRKLLESPTVMPEHERWTPTRWLMKASHEAVHGKSAALATIVPSLRSAADNDAHVIDLYRKLSGDFGSSKEEVVGTGARASGRAERSYVFSSQLRHWLHEIPSFVPTPSGWQPPPEPPVGGGTTIGLLDDAKVGESAKHEFRTGVRL